MNKVIPWERDKKAPYYKVGDRVILTDVARYGYQEDGWAFDFDCWFRNIINSNDGDEISEDEARKIVEEFGGTNFDKQDSVLVIEEGDDEQSV